MKSKRRHEGYLLLDNRNNEGLTEAMTVASGLPTGAGRGVFEAPTITCSHCQTVVVLNPDRQRERPYCRKCDHYICDVCGPVLAQTGVCKTFQQIIDETLEFAVKQVDPSQSLITTL